MEEFFTLDFVSAERCLFLMYLFISEIVAVMINNW